MIIKRKRNNDNNEPKQNIEQTKEVVDNASNDDLLSQFSIDNINFEQRAERRQGSRRRGYRRIDDRNLISRAQEEAISIKELAAKEGHKMGIEAAKADISELKNAINEFFSYKDKVYEEISDGVLDIAVAIAQKIINKEFEKDNEALLNIISQVLQANAKGENRVTIKVMPDVVDDIKEELPEVLDDLQLDIKISVKPDKSIVNGGAIIETSNGVVDATIDTQLDILKEAFKKI